MKTAGIAKAAYRRALKCRHEKNLLNVLLWNEVKTWSINAFQEWRWD